MTPRALESQHPLTPAIRKIEDQVVEGLCIDRIVSDGRFLALSGWFVGNADLLFATSGGLLPTEPRVIYFSRPDVAEGYAVERTSAKGFLALWSSRPPTGISVQLPSSTGATPLRVEAPAIVGVHSPSISELVNENLLRGGLLLEELRDRPAVVSELVKALSPPPPAFNRARGHLETARGVEGIGGLVVGWIVGEPGLKYYLADDAGHLVALDSAARWTRSDIIDAMGREFGDYAYNAGFLQSWRAPLRIGSVIKLIVVAEETAFTLSETKWVPAPIEPVSFVRWAFDIPTPRETFFDRLSRHDGPIIDALISRKIARRDDSAIAIQRFGAPPRKPLCSVVVPLHGRHDFMLNQLLALSDDPDFVRDAELIYVIDDPRLVSPLSVDGPMFLASFGVPFQTVWAGQNRGFAGATNLGVAAGSAPYVLLMNSDVIPIAPGWLDQMLATLSRNPKVGMLGIRLHHPNGTIQHDGMEFKWEPTWSAFLNKHPGAGLPASPPTGRLKRCQAVTAACVLLRRDVYNAAGGLDEAFLIGDFEDSDLCLKVRELGMEVACLETSVSLIHLERQSFSAIGSPTFRDFVARYNAWRHQIRWGATISRMASNDQDWVPAQ